MTNGFRSTIFGRVETDRLLNLLLSRQLETDLFQYLDVQNPHWYAALLKASLEARRMQDHPSMERLRNIIKLLKLWRQKAGVENLIFTAPDHSRFEDTLGSSNHPIALLENAAPDAHYARSVPWRAAVYATSPLAPQHGRILATIAPGDAISISIPLLDRGGNLHHEMRCEIRVDRGLFFRHDDRALAPHNFHSVSGRQLAYIAEDPHQWSYQLGGFVSRFDDQRDVDHSRPADAESPADEATLIEVALTLTSLGRTQQRLLEAMNEYEAELQDLASWAHSFMASPEQASAPEGAR